MAVAIEDKKAAVWKVKGPGRFEVGGVGVVGLRGEPFLKDFASERGFQNAMGRKAGEKEDLALAFLDDGKAMGAGERQSPLVR